MSYYIKPNSTRHKLLQFAAEKDKNDMLTQGEFVRRLNMSSETNGWSLARTMRGHGLVTLPGKDEVHIRSTGRCCRITDKGRNALSVVNDGYIYSVDLDGPDKKKTDEWLKEQSNKPKPIIEGPNNKYWPNTHFHYMLVMILYEGVEVTKKKYKKHASDIKKNFGRMEENKLIFNDKLTHHGKMILAYMSFGIRVQTQNIQETSLSEVIESNINWKVNDFLHVINPKYQSSIDFFRTEYCPHDMLFEMNTIFSLIKDQKTPDKIIQEKDDIIEGIWYWVKQPSSYCRIVSDTLGVYKHNEIVSHNFYNNCIDIFNWFNVNVASFENEYQKYNTLYQIQHPQTH